MSGQQIGTVIGGAIGAYFGGPAGAQLGMAIGGMIGGAVDPTHINGPKIGDGQQQAATDGAPIAWVQGTAMVAGTIVQVSARRQVRHKDNGKGGPVVTTYTAVQDFAILICESSELRGSTMSQVLMVLQDGKLVYDVRPGSAMLADSYKWKANVDFLFGDETQLPHPTLEAITGVGNTPAYRGSCIAVFKNFDVSTPGDRIPSFQFVVASSGSPALSIPYDDPLWLYNFDPAPTNDFSALGYDDSAWSNGKGGFGAQGGGPAAVGQMVNTVQPAPNVGDCMWLRRHISATPGVALSILAYRDNTAKLWWNGELFLDEADGPLSYGNSVIVIPAGKVRAYNEVAYRVYEGGTAPPLNYSYASLQVSQAAVAPGTTTLAQIVLKIVLRGGLSPSDVDVMDMSAVTVAGYPIARQANAADCLLPLVQAYFAYASEYDAQLHFKFYGADANVVIDRADLIEGNDSNKGAIVSNLRNQSTEFPRRIVAAYMDPAQNYTVVNVPAERQATDVIAIGDQSFQIPVVMAANDAARAAQKALKVAYATLEGTLEYSTPFAGADVYLSLAAGEPLQMLGKRYVADEMIFGPGGIKFTTRYDRQSAYQSSVQAILGNAPTPPASPYSGPTTLIPMNLQAQRPQDSVGVYIAAASTDGRDSWRGCNVQVSYDGLATWQNAMQITMESAIGTVDSAATASSEPVVVDLVKYDLANATSAQLAAGANAFAVKNATGSTQLMQFATAVETLIPHQFQLTSVSRSLGGTVAAPLAAGDAFTLMDAVYFLPIDPSFAGRTLYFRGIGFGEVAEDAAVYSLVYLALIATESAPLVTEDGANQFTTESGTLALSAE